jgi:hypothetical protein
MNRNVVANVSKYYNHKDSEDVQLLVETYRSVKIIIMKMRLKCCRSKICRNLTTLSLWQKKEFSYERDFICCRHSENYCRLLADGLLFISFLLDLRLNTLLNQRRSLFLVLLAPRPLNPVTNSARSTVPNRVLWLGEARQLNLLKPCVYFVNLQLQLSKFLHFAHRGTVCVSNESRNKQWLFAYMTLTNQFSWQTWKVFTAQYELGL